MLDLGRVFLLVRKIFKFIVPVLFRRLFRRPSSARNYAEPIRQALEEMGLTYLKLGQYLAMRFDLLPKEVCEELDKLFEGVVPLPLDEVRRVVESELGGSLEAFYSEFEKKHLAAASVAQVHTAWTLDGEKVAVKVQRPGIERIFESDMRVLGLLAEMADYFKVFGLLSVRGVVEEFAVWTRREFNFILEGKTADRLSRHVTPHEVVPLVHWNLTTAKVITFEFIEGVSMARIAKLLDEGGIARVREELPNIDLEEALNNVANASLNQLFVTGFFHGDPHPGNILVQHDNSVAFVDFGIFGELTPYQRELLAKHIESLAMGNFVASFRYYAKLAIPTEESRMREFEKEGVEVLQRWFQASQNPDTPPEERHLGRVSGEMASVVRRSRVIMGAETLLFWRAINALDSTALRLMETYDLVAELRRFFERIRPGLGERLLALVQDRDRILSLAELKEGLNGYLGEALDRLNDSEDGYAFELEDSEAQQRASDKRARWLTAAINLVSLAMLSTNVYLPFWGRATCAASAGLVSLWAVTNLNRR